VRPELIQQTPEIPAKAQAQRALDLIPNLPVLLVFGGSRGARSINQAVTQDLPALLAISQMIHVTGTLDEGWVQAKRAELPPELQARYRVMAYLHEEMTSALLAADLVLSRAGASILGEFPAVGLPAILAPYPYAGAHQNLNANYLVQHEAAVVITDAELPQRLNRTLLALLHNPERLWQMGQASLRLAKPEAAAVLAQEILKVGNYGS
jgi:UDP-N-acetylglucosamine--N-acetylmuramyl-(pentapeptide) pyrophosphoryl-undecaprenol N-acetylglucosamine transferase